MSNHLINNIPYIDVEKLLNGQISPDHFLALLHDYGFVYLSNLDCETLNLNSQQFKKLIHCARQFFDLSLEEKMKYYIGDSSNHRGYVPLTEKGDYKDEHHRVYEAFDMSYALQKATKEDHQKLRGENVWPKEIIDFRELCENYYNKMFLLGKLLLRIFAIGLGLDENYFEQYTKYPPSQLRLIHYLQNNTLVENEDVAMGGHTDYECFTLLYQTTPGLQGYIYKEMQFRDLPVFKNTLLLIVGDMLNYMSNGYLKSFYHRVVNNGDKRFSIPFFMNLDFETEIKVLPKFECYEESENVLKQQYPNQIIVGHHLLAQLCRDFPYIKQKVDRGDFKAPFLIPKNNLFENKEFIDQTPQKN